MMRKEELLARVTDWKDLLYTLGVPEEYLRKRHGACPFCGGKDRYRWTNFENRGSYFCNGCGAGDGIKLLMLYHNWDFKQTMAQLERCVGGHRPDIKTKPARQVETSTPEISRPTFRIERMLRETCAIEDCEEAMAYLRSRGIYTAGFLRAHPTLEYWHNQRSFGRFAAIVVPVLNHAGDMVTAHVTYLENGKKLVRTVNDDTLPSRKLLSALTGHQSCAARLMPAGEELGIGEGIETMLSASVMHKNMPVWACLNKQLMAKFRPPSSVRHLHLFVDRDAAGFEAAALLMEALQGEMQISMHRPSAKYNDFNDQLLGEYYAKS